MQADHQHSCTCGCHNHVLVGNATKRNVNPLRMDPSRTLLIQRQFIREIRRRFELFRIELVHWLVKRNMLNLTISRPKQGIRATRKHTVHLNARYDFQTSADKVKSFRSWLKGQIASGDLTAVNAQGQPWTAEYIGSAYKKGLARAHMKELGVGRFSEKGSIAYKAAQDQFLRDSFAAPIRTDTLELLYTRAFNEMEGITDAMSTTLSRALTDGLANGLGADEIARSMLDELDSLEETRAYRIARTEVARAQAEGQLDGFETLGVDKLEMSVEFSTAGDEGVCPACRALANKHGGIYTVEQARGIIPVHPNCRCAWIPSTRNDTRSDKKAAADTEDILERNEAYSTGDESARSRTSAKSYNPSSASKQAKARANEKRIAGAVGGERTTGNAPFDVLVRGKYALEVKTMVDLRSNQITMRKECRERKLKWLASHKGYRAYTVVCDMRGGRTTFHIAKGVGSFRSSSLTKISLAQLAKILS